MRLGCLYLGRSAVCIRSLVPKCYARDTRVGQSCCFDDFHALLVRQKGLVASWLKAGQVDVLLQAGTVQCRNFTAYP